jgi:hypothetical protein
MGIEIITMLAVDMTELGKFWITTKVGISPSEYKHFDNMDLTCWHAM